MTKRKPLSTLVAESLAEKIRSGQLQPGAQLPTEAELCAEYDVSRTVVREAVARDGLRRRTADETSSAKARYDTLSTREREIMSLVTAGLMNKQVAGRLGLSEITVKIHRSNLMKKMAAQSLADLVRMAEALGVRDERASRYPSLP